MNHFINKKIEEFREKFTDSVGAAGTIWKPNIATEKQIKDIESFLQSSLQEMEERTREETYKVDGMVALIKFIRNKARLDIMKADMYGQGYYQAIIDMENYFGISEVDILLSHKKESGEKEIQSDLLPFKHGEEGTHYACVEMAQKFKEHMKCCGCSGHDCHPPKKEDK